MSRTLFQNQKTQGTNTDRFRIRILASTEGYLPPKHNPKKGEILVVIRNGLVRPHSVKTHALVMKKITFFINVKATKP